MFYPTGLTEFLKSICGEARTAITHIMRSGIPSSLQLDHVSNHAGRFGRIARVQMNVYFVRLSATTSKYLFDFVLVSSGPK